MTFDMVGNDIEKEEFFLQSNFHGGVKSYADDVGSKILVAL